MALALQGCSVCGHMAHRTPTRQKGKGRKRVSSPQNRRPNGSSTKAKRAPANKTKVTRARPAAGRKAKSKSRAAARPSRLTALREWLRYGIGRQADDVWGLVLVVSGAMVALAFFEAAGPLGRWISSAMRLLAGMWAYSIPVGLVVLGVILITGRHRNDYGKIGWGALVAFVGSLSLFHLLTGSVALADSIDLVKARGGALGSLVAFPLRRVIGFWGAFLVLSAITSVGILVATRTSIREVAQAIVELVKLARRTVDQWRARPRTDQAHQAPPLIVEQRRPGGSRPKKGGPNKPVAESPAKRVGAAHAKPAPKIDTGTYQLPPLDLLSEGGGQGQSRRQLEETARELEEALRQHNVDARLTKIVPGPTVTRYEIELAPGVKVSRVTNLANDIAYALATPDVRLLAPIPGKSAIGVEVPNRRRQMVTLRDVLGSPEAKAETHPLVVALGQDISGAPQMLNLAELPHVLIAGATGAGKSSCINVLVTSLLMRTTPQDVRLIMVDPKRVELGQYNGVPHLLTKVITNPKKASDALQWAVGEMDRRYDLLADSGVRDIVGYREKFDSGGLDPDGFDRFPYLVIIIDELNDLMMVAGRDVEDSIVRIAQMARAVGIHLVIATQRPSVNVITGVIKANVPSRLAFSVASQTDSRVIIDTVGAEKLIGMGDMLVVTAREPRPTRVQGAWVEESEVHAVVDWVKAQMAAEYQQIAENVAATRQQNADADEGEDPELLRQAIELVVRSQLGSTSMLQRKLRVGFARAGRLMDILEHKGVVGPSEGSKARQVLITIEELPAPNEERAGV